MLTGLFMLWTIFIIWKRGFRSHAIDFRYSWKQKFESIPKIAPFIAIIAGVMYVLYGGGGDAVGGCRRRRRALRCNGGRHLPQWSPDKWWAILRDTTRSR